MVFGRFSMSVIPFMITKFQWKIYTTDSLWQNLSAHCLIKLSWSFIHLQLSHNMCIGQADTYTVYIYLLCLWAELSSNNIWTIDFLSSFHYLLLFGIVMVQRCCWQIIEDLYFEKHLYLLWLKPVPVWSHCNMPLSVEHILLSCSFCTHAWSSHFRANTLIDLFHFVPLLNIYSIVYLTLAIFSIPKISSPI